MVGGNDNGANADGQSIRAPLDLDAALDDSEEWSEEALSRMPMSELARIGTPTPGRFSPDWAAGVKTGMPVAPTAMTTRVAPRLDSTPGDEAMQPQPDAAPEPDDILPFETAVEPAPEPAPEPPQKVRRKTSPVLPLLGALLLAGIGGGTYYFLTQRTPSDDELVTPPSMPDRPRPPKPPAPPQSAPPQAVAQVPPANIAKPAAPKPVMAPAKPAAPMAPPTPQMQAQLKKMWKQGAAAKHRKDYATARRMWTQMLQMRPNHPGIQEAINKLPR